MPVAVLAPFALPAVRGNAVTVQRIVNGLRARHVDVAMWDLSAAPEASIAAAVEGARPHLVHAFHALRTGPLALRLARRLEIPLVVTLTGTDANHELLDPLLPPDRLLYRLFHEEQVRAYRAINLETYCSCSRERVEELLRRFTSEDLKDMVVDGEVWVTCEFCNSRYHFDPANFIKSDDAD